MTKSKKNDKPTRTEPQEIVVPKEMKEFFDRLRDSDVMDKFPSYNPRSRRNLLGKKIKFPPRRKQYIPSDYGRSGYL